MRAVRTTTRDRSRGRRPALGAALVVAALVTSACGSGGNDFTIGFKRVAIDLSYKDEALAKTPTKQDIAVPLPIPSQAAILSQVALPSFPTVPAFPKLQTGCPTAGPDVHPDHPATVFVTNPPAIGTYTTHNKGTITIEGAIPLNLPIPPFGALTIQNIQRSSNDDPVNGPTQIFTYDVNVPGLDGSTTTTYQVTYSPATLAGTVGQTAGGSHAPQGELDLVRLQVSSSHGSIDFRPQPPVTIMAFKNGEGTSWNSAGVDPRDGTSMVVQGSISKRTFVDLCGKVYDTYEVVSNEHIVNVNTQFSSNTSQSDPNVYRVATYYGGLFVQQHINTTTSFPGANNTPTLVTAVYDQTFNSITPAGS